MAPDDNFQKLQAEVEELRRQLEEAQETLRAIRSGEVEALLVQTANDVQVFTLESADRPYRAFLEEMQQGALSIDGDGVILYSNQCFADLIQTPPEAVLGQPLQTFVDDASIPYLHALLNAGRTTRSQGELVFKSQDMKSISGYITINPLHVDDRPTFCILITDLTDQKRYQGLLADQQLGQLILDQAVDAIVVCDSSGIIIRVSQTARLLARENPLLQPFEKVFPLSPSRNNAFSIRAVLAGETIHGAECTLPRLGKEQADVLVSAGPLRNAEDATVGCVITLSDITKLKRVESQLYEKVLDLEKFAEAVVGRELKMIELEKEITQLRCSSRDLTPPPQHS